MMQGKVFLISKPPMCTGILLAMMQFAFHIQSNLSVACLPGCAVGLEFEAGPMLHTSLPADVI